MAIVAGLIAGSLGADGVWVRLADRAVLSPPRLRAGDRYRQAGAAARVVERGPLHVVVELDRRVDSGLVEEAIAIERECCPFYELGWDPGRRRLGVAVSRPEQAPALEAVAFALGLETPVGRSASD